jgi:tetratricopeptide (TPR) repeat protein
VRVLLGPLNRHAHRAVLDELDGLDVLAFDRADADLRFDPAREPLENLWARLPRGWRADLLLWWSPEYALLPEGIERCPVPSIVALGDWNLGLWATAPLLEAFDWVVTDRAGVRALGPQLGVPVDHWPMFSFDRALHRPEPHQERDIEVLFVGNLNPDVQTERMPWLGRLVRLGGRRRVVIASGVYGEAYADLLRRARIVWNRSIRGELNMRAYEAAASGALLLMEADNLEVRDVFSDGVSCALYDAATLERVIETYLGAPSRLEAVAEAGWRRVQSETYRAHFERLLAAAGPLKLGPRPFATLPPWRRDYWLGLHALMTPDPAHVEAALVHFTRAAGRGADPAAVAAALGATATVAALDGGPDRTATLENACRLLRLAVELDPGDVVSLSNLGWAHALAGRHDEARAAWLKALERLQSEAAFPLDRLPLPAGFDRFRTLWEAASVVPDLEGRAAAFRPLLRARIAARLAGGDPVRAADWWAESVAACPGVDGNLHGLAGALAEGGQGARAAEIYERLLEVNAFDWPARTAAVALARDRGDQATIARLAAEAALLARALGAPVAWPAGAPR